MGWAARERPEDGDEEELSGPAVGAALDVDAGETVHRLGGRFTDRFRRRGLLKERPTLGELHGPCSVGEQPEVSDAHKARGQDVQEESPDELGGGQ